MAPAKTAPGNEVTSATPSAPASAAPPVIVVLGARVRPDGRPSGAMERRMQVALGLYHAGVAPQLLLSGGGGHAVPEAEVMRGLAIAAGVPESALLIEPLSRNTQENATHTAALLGSRGATAVILVTDRYHALRARVLFALAGLTVRSVHVTQMSARQRMTMLIAESLKLPLSVAHALWHRAAGAMHG